MIPVPLFDLKFLNEPAASGVGTSNRRHWRYLAMVAQLEQINVVCLLVTAGARNNVVNA
jgi:hypothetical protein